MNYDRTPRNQIKGMLRQMFVKSRERSHCLKRDNYTCQICKAKQSVKKGNEVRVEVHHIEGIDVWDDIILLIQQQLLCHPDLLQTLCVDCHKRI
jgi:5-methylcytosine-specific restriction endonuclease McrA